jgi:hypothetical protein
VQWQASLQLQNAKHPSVFDDEEAKQEKTFTVRNQLLSSCSKM